MINGLENGERYNKAKINGDISNAKSKEELEEL